VRSFLRSFYLTPRAYAALLGVATLFALGFSRASLGGLAEMLLVALGALIALDAVLLYAPGDALSLRRDAPDRFSNGDDNPIDLVVENRYRFAARVALIDEGPVQMQVRDARFRRVVPSGEELTVRYTIRPTQRGRYRYGDLIALARSPLGLVERRYAEDAAHEVAVYPSFLQMRRYELLALSDRLREVGVKKMRRLGHTMEFDQIREYVQGDDIRTLNWKATARQGELMVNQYQDERAQPVIAVVDAGRTMKMPFGGLTLLDHSINAALVLANTALVKGDRAGLVVFEKGVQRTVVPERRPRHIATIQEALYAVETGFEESDYERLYVHLRRVAKQRSLLLLFTNFETRTATLRQLAFLRGLAKRHVVVVVFFVNTELDALLEAPASSTEDIYVKAIAEKLAFEKREVVRKLQQSGIYTILTPPEQLTAATVNRYLDFKSRGLF
jgi:uncharacterized protein (DUF58 family)